MMNKKLDRRAVSLSCLPAVVLFLLSTGCAVHKPVDTDVKALQKRIYELQKKNAEAQVELQDMQERQAGGGADTGAPATEGSFQPGEEPEVTGSTVDLGESGPSRSDEAPASGTPGSGPASSPEGPRGAADKLFVDAYAQFNGGDYQKAQDEFTQFLSASPQSDLADDAQYWIGECLFSRKDYRRAIPEFRKVIDQYPFGNRVPHAFLKVGLSYLAMGDRERATESLETVVQAFPKSEVATVAQATLDELKKPAQR
jgi:tol-pal system protein YbgF